MQAADSTEALVNIFRDDEHATFLLYESGTFRKPVTQTLLSDKTEIISELKDGTLYSCWGAIQQLRKGLQNLNVLMIIKTYPEIIRDFFCF